MHYLEEIRHLVKSTEITHFPIGLKELKQIIEKSGWEIYSYNDGKEIIDKFFLRKMAEKNDSFTAYVGDRIVIFYDDNISQLDFPHILGHEIGHIVLGHLDSSEDIYNKERNCEIFSKELLNYSPRYFILPALMFSITGLCILALILIGSIRQKRSDDMVISLPEISTENIEQNDINSSKSQVIENVIEDEDVVYITSTGSKYHLEGCQYIKGKTNLIEFSIGEAEAAGYEPCKICFW